MKKILLIAFVLISVQSFGQLKRKYGDKLNADGTKDSFYIKLPISHDSVFNYSNDGFAERTLEYFVRNNLPIPAVFSNFHFTIDGYKNYTPRAEAVHWDGVNNKPSTFPATATTVGASLLGISNPASTSLINVNTNGTVGTRTLAQVKSDLSIENIDNTSDANKPVSAATQTALNNKTTYYVGTDAGANDSYVVTLSPVPAALTTGMIVIFKANTANTTGCTINVNGLGVVNIVKRVSTTPATNDILAQMWCMLIYNGGTFVLLNPVVN